MILVKSGFSVCLRPWLKLCPKILAGHLRRFVRQFIWFLIVSRNLVAIIYLLEVVLRVCKELAGVGNKKYLVFK